MKYAKLSFLKAEESARYTLQTSWVMVNQACYIFNKARIACANRLQSEQLTYWANMATWNQQTESNLYHVLVLAQSK